MDQLHADLPCREHTVTWSDPKAAARAGRTMAGLDFLLAPLLDSVMGRAVHSTLPQGRAYTTLEFKVNYLHAVTEAAGMVSAEGRVVHAGQQAAVAEARLTDAAGKLHATASTTCLVFDLPDARARASGAATNVEGTAVAEGASLNPKDRG